MLELTLPWPPSTNRYWRNLNGRTLISRDGRAFRRRVAQEALQQGGIKRIKYPIRVQVDLYAPDRRRRDIDNFGGKALLDALEHAGVFADDTLIERLVIQRRPPIKRGCAVVRIERAG